MAKVIGHHGQGETGSLLIYLFNNLIHVWLRPIFPHFTYMYVVSVITSLYAYSFMAYTSNFTYTYVIYHCGGLYSIPHGSFSLIV